MSNTLSEMENDIKEFDFHMETNQDFFDQHSRRNEVMLLLEKFKEECDQADRVFKDEVIAVMDELI